jgi:hypothetical protein
VFAAKICFVFSQIALVITATGNTDFFGFYSKPDSDMSINNYNLGLKRFVFRMGF